MASGNRLSLEQARSLLGQPFAAETNLGWLTGKIIAVVDRPQIVVEDQHGVIHHIVIDIVHDWAAPDPPAT